ncbi:hypothetical protein KIN20_010678 [Parelaphostrongylus tenuis]|uniref:Uncharacterized protein n=1 Tax=Parelaphostrongylus tenuis TaxID=148309 RepID=A0AAD5MS80_PARTN|nr:hypothetical protein KIN20_010678 [Parelaphostrongylus tenuis]
MDNKCIIVDNTVTGICVKTMRINGMCMRPNGNTTNIIMANWSRMMWQSVVNRAIRMLASGPFRLHFVSTTATVSGN